MILQLTKGPWRKGATPDPIEYAKLSAVYTDMVSKGSVYRTNLILAIHYEVPVITIKERIKRCRDKGFLTYPGRGIRGKSAMTYKTVELLREAELIL